MRLLRRAGLAATTSSFLERTLRTPNIGVMTWANASDAYSTDCNGFRPNKGVAAQYRFFAPPEGQKIYEPKRDAFKFFATLKGTIAATGKGDRHAVSHAMDLNFKLKPNSTAVDAGVVIPKRGPRWLTWQPFYR